VIYLLRDDLFGAERLNEIRARLGPPDLQGLNTTVLDGSRLTVGELRAAVAVVPFLGARRLVIVRRLFGGRRADGAGEATAGGRRASQGDARMQDILDYLPAVPAETDLVFIEDEAFDRDHPVVRQIARLGGEVYLPDPPRGEYLVPWIVRRVRAKGGRIAREAAEVLAELVEADDLRRLDLTLDLLITYVGEQAISPADVRTLVAESRDADVFALVDAVGARDGRRAFETYRRLLGSNASPIYIVAMLARQMRLLLLTHEAMARREDVVKAVAVHPRVAQKLARQARTFGAERCIAAVQRLAEVDQAIKTGEIEEELAVELLLAELTGVQAI
jgi:DNA polymerase-3 subunit delta